MGEWVDIPLATQAGEGQSPFESDAELTNLMLVPSPPGSPRPFAVMNTPSLVSAISGSGFISPLCRTGSGHMFWVQDGALYYTANGSTKTSVGAVNNNSYYRLTPWGLDTILLTNLVKTYIATSSSITEIAPPAGTYVDVMVQDGTAIYPRYGTDEWYVSAVDDATSIGALDFSTLDATPDTILGGVTDHRDLILFGYEHAEFWYNSGDADFPFVRASPGVIELGVFDIETVAKHSNAVYFLGNDLRVHRLEGYRPTPVSTPWIDRLIRANTSDKGGSNRAFGTAFTDRGRAYYHLSLGPSRPTVCLDIEAGLWHRRDYYTDNARVTGAVEYYSSTSGATHIYCAANSAAGSGAVYKMDEATYRDSLAGADTSRVLTCPAVDGGGARMFESEVEICMEKVNGGSPGTVTFSYSDDGGASYTTHGAQSTNQDRIRWTRCGSFYRRIHRFTFATNARVAITQVRARLDRGAA